MKISILMPVYNERPWIESIVEMVFKQEVEGVADKELIIVDDCSTDGTGDVLLELCKKYPQYIKVIFHVKNQGKGAALRTGIEHMTGDICIIQDADMEYSPLDYPIVLKPIIDGRADCVYGSRFLSTQAKRVLFFWHSVGNNFLTLLSNMLTNLTFTDMETCYKAFRCDFLKSIPIRSNRFGFEPEITAKIAKRKARIYEVGITYNGRTYEEGKKITWLDGVAAIWTIIKFWIIDDSKKEQPR